MKSLFFKQMFINKIIWNYCTACKLPGWYAENNSFKDSGLYY